MLKAAISDIVTIIESKESIESSNIQEPSEKPTTVKKVNSIEFQEEQSTGYRERTIKNAKADATIALAVDFTSAGVS